MYAPHYRDSYGTSDFESVYFYPPKQTTGPEFYDHSNLSRMVGLAGVGIAVSFSACCIVEGFMIYVSKNTISSGIVVVPLTDSWQKELVSLALNLMVAACTEATGFVHGIALRSALASERRLLFNTNLRLLSAASGFFNPNGTCCNFLMSIFLVVSYGSSLLVALSVDMTSSSGVGDARQSICVADVPLIVLGISILLQAIIALAGAWSADILTWSSSPFDITAALVHHAQVVPEPGRCMRSVGDRALRGPVMPSPKQSSAWRVHLGVRRVVMTLWALVIVCIAWGIIMVYVSEHNMTHAAKSWSFFPRTSHVIVYSIPLTSGVYWYWLLYYLNMAAIQGPLTLALHCAELVVNVIRDERMWRKATTEKGLKTSSNPLVLVFGNTLNVGLLASKPLLHWMLGLAISLAGRAEDGYLRAIAVSIWPFQVVNYSGALLILLLALTVIVLYRPRGPQPAAYGHIETLANLIDEWSPRMWWGHKEGGYPYHHAGTSDRRLPEVKMNVLYA